MWRSVVWRAMIALLTPRSPNACAKLTTTMMLAIRPKSLGSRKCARTDTWTSWRAVTAMAEVPVHLTPDAADRRREIIAPTVNSSDGVSVRPSLAGPLRRVQAVRIYAEQLATMKAVARLFLGRGPILLHWHRSRESVDRRAPGREVAQRKNLS